MSTEQILTIVLIASFAFLVVASYRRYYRSDQRWSAEALRRMKTEFFPQLDANLCEILRKLEASEAGEYATLLIKGLSATLSIEFRMRLGREAGKMDQLHDLLVQYEEDLKQLDKNPEDAKLKARVEGQNAELRGRASELIMDIEKLSKLEHLPSKSPSGI